MSKKAALFEANEIERELREVLATTDWVPGSPNKERVERCIRRAYNVRIEVRCDA